MKYIKGKKQLFQLSPLSVAFATVLGISSCHLALAESVPPGFHLMPDGKMMADNPETAVAPEGYHLRPNGILLKIDFDDEEPAATPSMPMGSSSGDIPPGFHKMPDGTLMANDPKTAIAPPGYHMMPDGTLMSNSGGGSHHGKGMWMLDYKYIRMNMKDLLDTNLKLTGETAVNPAGKYKYMMAPTSMTMDMHMGMVMYGFTDQFMGMLMLHYMSSSMGMESFEGTKSTMKSSGIGDTIVSGMFQGPHKLNFTVGISLPTGSTDVRGLMTHQAGVTNEQKYPYGMQLGSGSYELKQGIEFSDTLDTIDSISWGAKYMLTARLNDNKHDYRLGNVFELEGWSQWEAHSLVSVKAMLKLRSQGRTTGSDEEMDRDNTIEGGEFFAMSPSLSSENYGGNRIDAGGAIKFKIPGDIYSITTDFSMPIYQNLWGPQMATSWIASINFGAMW